MATCRLLLLGPPQLQRDGRVTLIRLRKAVALLAYLAVEQRAFSREYLAALLWPNMGEKDALANLRRTLSQIRATVANGCIVADGDQLQLDRSAVPVDVEEFLALAGERTEDADLARLEAAAGLYRGSFLEGFNLGDCLEFDEWQDAVRERLEVKFDGLLETLCSGHLQGGTPGPALAFAHRWLDLDHTNEAAHRALMEAHARSGRSDLARRQFEACVRVLEREGMTPDEETVTLHDAIAERRLPAAPAPAGASGSSRADDGGGPGSDPAAPGRPARDGRRPAARPGRGQRTRRRRRGVIIGLSSAAVVVVVAIVAVHILRFEIFGCDLSPAGLQVVRRGGEASALEFTVRNTGVAVRGLEFDVVFSSDGSIGTHRDYVAYSGSTRIGRNGTETLRVDMEEHVGVFVRDNDIPIPPGTYTAAVVVDAEQMIRERSEHNNRASGLDAFFYLGAPGAEALEVEILHSGDPPFDAEHPLTVTIGDRADSRFPLESAEFTVTAEGRYFFPLAELPRRDDDGSGYFMMIEYDVGNNRETDPGDVAALYKETLDKESGENLVYGGFSVAAGTPMFPGRSYRVDFVEPALPPPDAYEVDDFPELATVISYADLPARQYHTLHHEGSGDLDGDWFRIYLRAGDRFTVETFSGEGLWECDTQIDIADAEMEYITSNRYKSESDSYSRLTYTNATGMGQRFHVYVKPWNHPAIPPNRKVGEYIVEFRR